MIQITIIVAPDTCLLDFLRKQMARKSNVVVKPVIVFCDCKPEDIRMVGSTGRMGFCSKHNAIVNIVDGSQSIMNFSGIKDEVIGRK